MDCGDTEWVLQMITSKKNMVKVYLSTWTFFDFYMTLIDVLSSLEPFATVFMWRNPIF